MKKLPDKSFGTKIFIILTIIVSLLFILSSGLWFYITYKEHRTSKIKLVERELDFFIANVFQPNLKILKQNDLLDSDYIGVLIGDTIQKFDKLNFELKFITIDDDRPTSNGTRDASDSDENSYLNKTNCHFNNRMKVYCSYEVLEISKSIEIRGPSENILLETWNEYRITFLLLLSTYLISYFLLLFFLRLYISNPMNEFSKQVSQRSGDEINKPFYTYGSKEIRNLADSINGYIERYRTVSESNEILNEQIMRREEAEVAAVKALNELKDAQNKMLQVEKLSALGTFVGGVAHELNNPLMGVLNYINYVQRKPDSPKVPETLEKATREILRMSRIVKNLLLYARGTNQKDESNCNVNEVIEYTKDILAARAKKEGIVVKIDTQTNLPKVEMSSDSLQQILMNLVTNAFDALDGVEEKIVKIETLLENNKVILSVSDYGHGIPSEIRSKIFDPFFTTKAPGKGTGLGLSVVTQLTSDRSATIEVGDTDTGKGTKFSIYLRTQQ